MAKQRKTRNRQRVKHNRKREFCTSPHAENYYKKQVEIINKLSPVMTAAKRFRERRGELTPATPYTKSE